MHVSFGIVCSMFTQLGLFSYVTFMQIPASSGFKVISIFYKGFLGAFLNKTEQVFIKKIKLNLPTSSHYLFTALCIQTRIQT